MFSTKFKLIFAVVLFSLLSMNLFAQGAVYKLEQELDEILLKKDLLEVIKDAEKSSENNLENLYKRLILYRRAVNFQKIPAITKQILLVSKNDKSGFHSGDILRETLKDELFQDAEVLQIYLKNPYSIDDEIFKKLTEMCKSGKAVCDVSGFDNWLAQKVLENRDKEYYYGHFFDYRLRWRESFGLSNTELLNQFAIDFRTNPADLDAAFRYLGRFNTMQTLTEIIEKFASKQACDYHVLGERLISSSMFSGQTEDYKTKTRFGIQLLNKSLEIPFNEKDTELMWKYYFITSAVDPQIGNYEKQLRFWTKTKLAETYHQIGEANKAQPLVEEIAKLDKSDIQAWNTSYLAGAVQADSGARVVEKKILSEEQQRENSAEYWIERANYYRGRNELLLVLEAYYEGFKNFPAKLNENSRWQERLRLIDSFARFSEANFKTFAERAKDENEEDLSEETKQKFALWKKTEDFLRTEFQATKANYYYFYSLIRIIENTDFTDLLDEIFQKNTEYIIKIYRELPSDDLNMNLAGDFLENETVGEAKKEEFLNQLFNIALTSKPDKGLQLIGFINYHTKNFAALSLPVLHRNLDIIKEVLKSKNLSFNEREDLEYLADDYLPVIFSAYIKAENWRDAEKFMQEKFDWSEKLSYERHALLKRLTVAAAENGDYADAVRLWKTRANLDRRDLEELSTLAKFGEVRGILIEFYQKMSENEPYSPIPEKALNILK